MKIMTKATALLIIATTFILTSFPVIADKHTDLVFGEYKINVKATPIDQYKVNVDIQTNIPGATVLAVSLALKGQKPLDTFIGTDFIKAPVVAGNAKVTIDGSERVFPYGTKLPAGDYDVEVSFNPNWTENKVAANVAKITDRIEGKYSITLSASGQSSNSAKATLDSQKWLTENFYMNYPWKPEFWRKKFGELKQVEYRGSGNSRILKMYYIKSIDRTLLINNLKKEIITYRTGLVHE